MIKDDNRSQILKEAKRILQKAVKSQNIEVFGNLIQSCPIPFHPCDICPLFDKDASERLKGSPMGPCLIASTVSVYYWDWIINRISKEDALAKLVLEGIKLLAYLESKE